jgi:hypothetical protein
MQNDALQRDLPTPNEACARYHYLREGVDAPDVTLILQWVPDRPRRLIYRIYQQWVKNNRDPENALCGLPYFIPNVHADISLSA